MLLIKHYYFKYLGNRHAPECALTDKNLVDISNFIGNGWEFLAVCLKFSLAQIEQIKADHRESIQKQIFYMLLKWKNTEGCKATLTSLLDEMIKVPGVTIDWNALQHIFGPVVDNGKCHEISGTPASQMASLTPHTLINYYTVNNNTFVNHQLIWLAIPATMVNKP